MNPETERRNQLIREKCNRHKKQLRAKITEAVVADIRKEHPGLSENTIRCIWKDRNYAKRKKKKKTQTA